MPEFAFLCELSVPCRHRSLCQWFSNRSCKQPYNSHFALQCPLMNWNRCDRWGTVDTEHVQCWGCSQDRFENHCPVMLHAFKPSEDVTGCREEKPHTLRRSSRRSLVQGVPAPVVFHIHREASQDELLHPSNLPLPGCQRDGWAGVSIALREVHLIIFRLKTQHYPSNITERVRVLIKAQRLWLSACWI